MSGFRSATANVTPKTSGKPGFRAGPRFAKSSVVAQRYERHRPETTLLHRVVRGHLETLLVTAREDGGDGLPRYVEQEFRKYVKCGILAHGFGRARCKRCGADIFVAFSCKGRGVCRSCGARRMANTAAHLVDHVLPDLSLRQWVLSVPFDIGALMARDARLLSSVLRIFVDVVSKWHIKRGASPRTSDAKTGGVSFVQRFGSTLNLHVHFHVMLLDGVFVDAKDSETLAFHSSPKPTVNDVHSLTLTVLRRVRTLLRRRGFLDPKDEEAGNESTPAAKNIPSGIFANIDDTGCIEPPSPPSKPKRDAFLQSSETCGFTIDASVRIPAGDFEGRERLCRYGARHPFSLERLSETADGRIAYRMKKPRQGKRFLVTTPVGFLRRLAFLVPPPFYPLIRYHGVFAPNSKWRSRVVRANTGPKATGKPLARCAEPTSTPPAPSDAHPSSEIAPDSPPNTTPTVVSPMAATPGPTLLPLATALLAATTSRLSRFEWATLLKRLYDVDALKCPRCDGHLDFIAVITDPVPVREILEHVGLPSSPPVLARARDPTDFAPSTFFDDHP